MKSKYFFFLLLCWTATSCEKDGLKSDAATGTGKGGSLAKFTIVGNYLYVLNANDVVAYNIENPARPAFQSSVMVDWGAETLFPYNDKLFIGSQNGMFIYSLNEPAAPSKIGQAQHLRACDPVVANDSVAFVTLRGNACGPATDGLYVYNIKDITKPLLTKTVEMRTPSGLGLNDSILYVCQQQNGLSVYNVKQPANPLLRKTITDTYFEDVIVYNNILVCYVLKGLQLYDISSPADPVLLTSLEN